MIVFVAMRRSNSIPLVVWFRRAGTIHLKLATPATALPSRKKDEEFVQSLLFTTTLVYRWLSTVFAFELAR